MILEVDPALLRFARRSFFGADSNVFGQCRKFNIFIVKVLHNSNISRYIGSCYMHSFLFCVNINLHAALANY